MSKVTVAGTDHEVPPLNGVAGLEAAQMLIPHLVVAQGAIDRLAVIAATAPVDEAGNVQLGQVQIQGALSAAAGIGEAMLPLLKPDDFVHLTSLLTSVPEEELRKATLGELLDAAAVGLVNADIRSIMGATGKIYQEILRGSRNAAPAPQPSEAKQLQEEAQTEFAERPPEAPPEE